MDIVFATRNKNKLKEAKEIMKDTKYNILSLDEIGFYDEIIEDGLTYEENAEKKSLEVSKFTNKTVFADDSGLEINFIDRNPGIYSSRFLGKDTPYIEKNKKILEMLKNAKGIERKASFICVISLILENKEMFIIKSTMNGLIADSIKGRNGFGYDPIFYVEEFGKTISEISTEEKNKISHRAKALREMKKILLNIQKS